MAKQITKTETSKRTFNEIAREYAPYDRFPEFMLGAQAYMENMARNMGDGVAAQAYDRGMEAAMKYTRQYQ